MKLEQVEPSQDSRPASAEGLAAVGSVDNWADENHADRTDFADKQHNNTRTTESAGVGSIMDDVNRQGNMCLFLRGGEGVGRGRGARRGERRVRHHVRVARRGR